MEKCPSSSKRTRWGAPGGIGCSSPADTRIRLGGVVSTEKTTAPSSTRSTPHARSATRWERCSPGGSSRHRTGRPCERPPGLLAAPVGHTAGTRSVSPAALCGPSPSSPRGAPGTAECDAGVGCGGTRARQPSPPPRPGGTHQSLGSSLDAVAGQDHVSVDVDSADQLQKVRHRRRSASGRRPRRPAR